MLAYISFDQIKARCPFPERDTDIAFVIRQKFAAAAFQLDVGRRHDWLGTVYRIAEPVSQ